MNSRKYDLICQICAIPFKGYRSSDKFCSPQCRWRSSFEKRTEAQILKRKQAFKKWGQQNWQRRRNYMLKYTFGITGEQYDELLRKQDGNCAICGRHNLEFSRKLAVDHDHVTGEIRGALCEVCNRKVIGKHRGSEGAEIFRKAAAYLDRSSYTGWIVPPKKKKRKKHGKSVKIRRRKRG